MKNKRFNRCSLLMFELVLGNIYVTESFMMKIQSTKGFKELKIKNGGKMNQRIQERK